MSKFQGINFRGHKGITKNYIYPRKFLTVRYAAKGDNHYVSTVNIAIGLNNE